MPQGYDGLPPSYIGLGSPLTPNLGLSLAGMDPLVAENFWLIDVFAAGGGGTSVFVNTVSVTNPNFNDTTPAAPPGGTNVIWQVSGSNVSAYVTGIGGTPGGNNGDIQFNNSGSFGGSDNFFWDNVGRTLEILSNTFGIFLSVDNESATIGQLTGLDVEMNVSGSSITIPQVIAAGVSTSVQAGNTATFVKNLILSLGNAGSVGNYIALDVSAATGTIGTALGVRIGDFSNSGDASSADRALQVLGGNIEFAIGTFLLMGSTVVDPTDPTRGFNFNFGPIVSGNIWNVNIPDADSSTAQNATVTANQALSGFNVSNGNFAYVPIPHTNAGGAGLALATYDSTTGLFTTIAVGSGTVTSFSAGNLSPLFTTSVATATTTPALTFALSNAGGGTVFGNNTTSAAASAYTTAPVLGIPGTSTGSIALASSTASGKFTVTAPASSSTPTLTLPTTSNVLAGQLAGDNVIYATTLQVASAAGTLTIPTPQNQNANIVFAGPSSGGAASPTFRALVTADIPNSTITPIWNNLQNATGALTLANAGNATTFNQTSAVNWTWANTTAATSGTSQSSPIFNINGTYWTGAASATDGWTIQDVVANGTNGTSALTVTHSGSTGRHSFQLDATTFLQWGLGVNGPANPGNVAAGFALTSGVQNGSVSLYVSNGSTAIFTLFNGGTSVYTFNSTGFTCTKPIVSYNGTATVSGGVPSEIVTVDLTAQTAAIGATNLTASAPQTGMYRIAWSADITTAGTTSTLGGTNGFQVGYTSPTDSVAKLTVPGNSITSAANTTATAIGGDIVVYAKVGTAITYRFDYASTGTAMTYELHIKLEAM